MNSKFESLEQRRLLSVSIAGHVAEHITLNSAGSLVVRGTSHADHISIKTVGSRVRVGVDDGVAYYTSTKVKAIIVAGGKGDDSIAANSTLDEVISGGDGNDTISSGSGDDNISGDAGDDSILAGAGDDTCHGGLGDDHIRGGSGTNDLSGDDGDDDISIQSLASNSHLAGGNGDDRIDTGDDRTTFVDAGAGDDQVHGRFRVGGKGVEVSDDGSTHDAGDDDGGGVGGIIDPKP